MRTRNRRIPLLAFIALTAWLTLVGCSRKTVFSRYLSIDASGWKQSDSLFFDIPPLATAGLYNAELALRANNAYPFTSLTLIVEQRSSLSLMARTDTLTLQMVDESGNSLGNGIGLKSYNIPLEPLALQEGDSLHVCVHHFMRRTPLPGIADVGFSLTVGDSAQRRYAGR